MHFSPEYPSLHDATSRCFLREMESLPEVRGTPYLYPPCDNQYITGRRWRSTRTLGGTGDWECEIGDLAPAQVRDEASQGTCALFVGH